MKKKIFFLVLIFLYLNSCVNLSIKKNDISQDSIFLKEYIDEKLLLNKFLQKTMLQTIILSNNLFVFIDYGLIKNINEGNWIFFIKEINSTNNRRNIYYSNNKILTTIPNYDSLYYDSELLNLGYYSIIWKDNEKKNLDKSFNYTKLFSERFYNLSELRKNDIEYQSKCKLDTSVNQIEQIINNLETFNNFNFNNEYQVDILKKILKLTQITILSINQNDVEFDCEYINNAFKMYDIKEISNIYELNNFKKQINEKSSPDIEENMVKYKWLVLNKDFLKTKISEIEKDFNKQNIFYFYTVNDLKLFKFDIKFNENGKIKIEKNFINKEYLWFHYQNAILIPKFSF